MTLNAVIALILRFLRNSTDFQADYITVVEDRPIMSVNIVSQFQCSTFGVMHPAARSLCDSWASCWYSVMPTFCSWWSIYIHTQ